MNNSGGSKRGSHVGFREKMHEASKVIKLYVFT